MNFSIHQPCYFPWLGLLSKIAASDTLIVLDQVQLSDSAFQHRNQFLSNEGKISYLTIPFVKQNYLKMPFNALKIADPAWATRHRQFLNNNYKKHHFFDQIYPKIQSVFDTESLYLFDVVMLSLSISMALLNISTRIILQSQLDYPAESKKGALILDLLHAAKADSYLSGTGAQAYQDESAFSAAGIYLHYQHFTHPIYPQKNTPKFIPGLSCLDLLFNSGTEAASLLLLNSSRENFNEIKNNLNAE